MRLYPTLPARRRATILGDLTVLVLVALFAALGTWVYSTVADLTSLGRSVQDAGTGLGATTRDAAQAVRGTLDSAAEAVEPTPVVGGTLADGLRNAAEEPTRTVEQRGRRTAQDIVAAGVQAEARALEAARVLGWATFLVPAILLLTRAIPARVRLVRGLTAAERVLGHSPLHPERAALLAERAAFNLPYAALARHTRDPVGELEQGRYDRLIAALAEDAGLRISELGPSRRRASAPRS